MPTETAAWGYGMTYGIVNMASSLPSVAQLTAHNPDPTNGSINAGTSNGSVVDVTLSWDAADDPLDPDNPNSGITSHKLYLKAGNSDFSSVTPITIPAGSPVNPRASYVAAGLAYNQTYYWQVDEVIPSDPSSPVEGPVWSFTTMLDPGSNNVLINPTSTYQIFEGFGEGTIDQFTPYWYSRYDTATLDAFLDKLYTLDNDGLGLKICRFIVPVGDAPGHNHMWGFMYSSNGQGPASFEPEEDVFDWTGHDDILWRVQGASNRNAKMWANWNSYPYWLTISGCTAGSVDGASDNLSTSDESRFIQHVCDVLTHFRDSWSIDFDYVSVVNECEADWWVADGGFPGTAVSSSQTIRLVGELKTQLENYSLPGQIIAYDAAYLNSWWYLDNLLTSAIQPDLSVLSVHQYHVSSGGLNAWRSRAQSYNKSLWMTEWGDWENDGYPDNNPHPQALNYAAKIHEALNELQVNAWIIWETDFLFDTPASGFIPRESYWTTAQYSRHIRPGMQRIASAEDNAACFTTAWIDPDNIYPSQTLAVVTYNSGSTPVTITFDFSSLPPVEIKQVHQTSQTQSYEQLSFTQTSTSLFSITVPAESTTTLDAVIFNCGTYKQADYNDDCVVDIYDLGLLAVEWLSELPCEELSTNLTNDCQINFLDFGLLFGSWNPTSP
jgi:O-glycosyl hydrolase